MGCGASKEAAQGVAAPSRQGKLLEEWSAAVSAEARQEARDSSLAKEHKPWIHM